MLKQEVELCMNEVMRECMALKIPISTDIDPNIIINKRARSRFAACKKKGSSPYIIEVGEALLGSDRMVVKNILAHEILHTCYGCYNHGKRWKLYADKMNRAYGYHITTTTTYEALGLEAPERKRTIHYVIVCQKCGHEFYRQKKSKLVTETNHYRCKCGGRLKCYICE